MRFSIIVELLILLFCLAFFPGCSEASGENETCDTETHCWDVGVLLSEATAEEADSVLYTCLDCGATRTEQYLVLDGGAEPFRISAFDGVSGGNSVLLRVPYQSQPLGVVHCQWFSCENADGEGAAPIPGAEADSFETGSFSETGIRYYFCELSYTTEAAGQRLDRSFRTVVFRVAYTGLPAVFIQTTDREPVTDKETYLSAEITVCPGADTDNFDEDLLSSRIGFIRGRGNSSWTRAKKSYNIKFAEKQDVLGMGLDRKWALIGNYAEKTQLRNWFSSELSRNVFHSEDWQARYVPVDLTLNGEYLGTFSLSTNIKISPCRVNIPDIACALTDVNGDGTVDLWDGGFVVEADARADATHCFETERGVSVSLKDPDLDSGVDHDSLYSEEAVFSHIKNYIQSIEDVIYADTFADPELGYRSVLDVDSFVEWYLVNELMKNVDANFFSSVFLFYDPADGLLHMGPNWDFDISSGNCSYDDCESPEGFRVKDSLWISRLFEDPYFTELVWTKWSECRTELLTAVNEAIQRKADTVAVSANFNFEKWTILGRKIWPNPASARTRTTYQAEVDYMVEWLNRRIDWMDGALAALRTPAG